MSCECWSVLHKFRVNSLNKASKINYCKKARSLLRSVRRMTKIQKSKMNKVPAKAAAAMLTTLNGPKILLLYISKRKSWKCKMKQTKKIFWIKNKLKLNNLKFKMNKSLIINSFCLIMKTLIKMSIHKLISIKGIKITYISRINKIKIQLNRLIID